jgi:serine/threonine protein kinase
MTSKLVGKILLDQFRVDAFIDAGNMGSVFRVWDLKRNVPLAMKVLHGDLAEDPSMLKRFRREARALEKLAHPNIIPFYGVYQTADFAFLLERFIDGPTLKGFLKQAQGKPLPKLEALSFLKAIGSALGYAHSNGVIHCDVKAANVMIDRGGIIYLTDFGIARHADSTTTTMAGAGTPAYMAPEQIEAQPVSPATDVYALGVLLFEMLTGQRPFRGTERGTESAGATANERIRYAHMNLAPPDARSLNPAIESELADVLRKSLEKDPAHRYQSCQEMVAAVCHAVGISQDQIPERVNISDFDISSFEPADAPVNPPNPVYENKPVLVPGPANNVLPGVKIPSRSGPKKNIWLFCLLAGVVLLVLVLSMPGKSAPGSTPIGHTSQPTAVPTQTLSSVSAPIKAVAASPTRIIEPTSTVRLFPTDTISTRSSCPGAAFQRVQKDDTVRVCTRSDRVIVRRNPEPGDNEEFRIYPDTTVKIIEGPQCSDNSSWWLVRIPKGITVFRGADYALPQESEGWVREGSDAKDPYYICKVN